MYSDESETAKKLVWAEVGKLFKDKDSERILAIALENPKYFLYTQYNKEVDTITKAMFKDLKNVETYLTKIEDLNQIHDLFMEVSKYLKETKDMLSTGSFLTTKTKKQNRLISSGIVDEEPKEENENNEMEMEI